MNRSPSLPSPKTVAPTARYQLVDLLRGTAIALMFIYHFAFDLDYFGALQLDLNHDPFWLAFRTLIVGMFLITMGISLQLATGNGIRPERYWRRLGGLMGAAALVSVGSYAAFPQSWIFFGVLHFIALASLLGLAFRGLGWGNLLLGVGLIGLGTAFSHPLFAEPWLQWVGMMPRKPITEDYVPLVPWFGFVLIGMFLGWRVFGVDKAPGFIRWHSNRAWARLLTFGGRHSLVIYLVHQPLFLALLWVVLAGRG